MNTNNINPFLYYFLEDLLKTESDVISFSRAGEVISKNKDCKISARRITAWLRSMNYLFHTSEGHGQHPTPEGMRTGFFICYQRKRGNKLRNYCGLTLPGLYFLESNYEMILSAKVK